MKKRRWEARLDPFTIGGNGNALDTRRPPHIWTIRSQMSFKDERLREDARMSECGNSAAQLLSSAASAGALFQCRSAPGRILTTGCYSEEFLIYGLSTDYDHTNFLGLTESLQDAVEGRRMNASCGVRGPFAYEHISSGVT